MRRLAAVGVLVVAAQGCVLVPSRAEPARLLAEADRLSERGDFEQARRAYDAFLVRYPGDAAVPRAMARRDAVVARADLARLRHDLAAREAEIAKLREELAKVRADLEKVKEIDLKGRER